MPRPPTWGTPTRSDHYPPLRQKWRLLVPSAMVAGAIALLLFGSHIFGARTALSPGSVSAAHAPFDASCEQCHTTGQGVLNVRCQRCHDPSSGGRLTHAAHVLFGSGDPGKAAAAVDVACAQCHVEHRGRRDRLNKVEDVQCAQCHFGSLGRHPEFAVLRAATAEAPGLKFGHQKHIEEVMKAERIATAAQTCGQCHTSDRARRDFEPVAFDQHCVGCHAKTGSVGSADPVPLTDVVDLEGWKAAGAPEADSFREEEFEISRGKVARPTLRHRDPWVLFNLAKLRAETDPDALTAERARLEARIAALDRRLAAATPFAALGREALEQRAAAIERESQGAAERLAAIAKAGDASSAAARLDEVEKSLRAAGDTAAADEVAALRQSVTGGAGPGPLPSAEFEARRQEVLSLLEAVEASDPELKVRTEDLRRRLVALQPGEDPANLLARVRDQRQAALARLRDELKLRAQGVAPPRASLLDAERRALEAALTDARAQLAGLSAVPAPKGALADDERQRKRETAEVLAAACLKCHVLRSGTVEPVRAARPVLVRATFVHEPHLLQADCARCHPGIEGSKLSQELNFKGIESCRECHRPFKASQDCRECHFFHPKAVP